MNTMTIDGVPVPIITSEVFLVDFGPETSKLAKQNWLAHFRSALDSATAATQGIPIAPVEIIGWGKSGRTVLKVWAPDPTAAVYEAERRMQDGPKVVAL
jgi:hypothetical protein